MKNDLVDELLKLSKLVSSIEQILVTAYRNTNDLRLMSLIEEEASKRNDDFSREIELIKEERDNIQK